MEITTPRFSNAHKLRQAINTYGEACEAFGCSIYDPDGSPSDIPRHTRIKGNALREVNRLISEYVDSVVHNDT